MSLEAIDLERQRKKPLSIRATLRMSASFMSQKFVSFARIEWLVCSTIRAVPVNSAIASSTLQISYRFISLFFGTPISSNI